VKKLLWTKDKPKMFVSRCVKAVSEPEHYLLALAMFGLAIQSGYVMAQCWRDGLPDVGTYACVAMIVASQCS